MNEEITECKMGSNFVTFNNKKIINWYVVAIKKHLQMSVKDFDESYII